MDNTTEEKLQGPQKITEMITYLCTYLLTYLLHAAESFLKS